MGQVGSGDPGPQGWAAPVAGHLRFCHRGSAGLRRSSSLHPRLCRCVQL
eukprot:jgi/Astpho2/4919/gw1.00069.91.1_t